MPDKIVQILENERVNQKYYRLTFESEDLASGVLPGHFMQVQISPALDPFLRRPFSYYRVDGNKVQVLYEILGRGTGILATKKPGDALKILGPLGKSFTQTHAKKRVLIAGGVGVPPLVFLAEQQKVDYLLIGTKSESEVMPESELANVQGEILYSTNDGSYGVKGFVTTLLEDLLKKEDPKNLFIQTCGPNVMMQAVMDIAMREGIEGEASIDKTMACGVGVCLGCMVKTPKGWVPSCTQGPVFRFDQVVEI